MEAMESFRMINKIHQVLENKYLIIKSTVIIKEVKNPKYIQQSLTIIISYVAYLKKEQRENNRKWVWLHKNKVPIKLKK